MGVPAFSAGKSAKKAVGLFASICHCEERSNFLNLFFHSLAIPGFTLQSLTQFGFISKKKK